MRNLFLLGIVIAAFCLSGCALTTGFRFGDDGSVSEPEVHGNVQIQGNRSL